ncbi:hypothetical protein SS31_20290 [Pluralibacter gergoviae]|nr:hypothetical protein SS31_20290 [Pluralibacter gergoviae]
MNYIIIVQDAVIVARIKRIKIFWISVSLLRMTSHQMNKQQLSTFVRDKMLIKVIQDGRVYLYFIV